MKPELVSFKICPFVQRAVIILLEKNIPFDIIYIDLKDPPSWFLEISPFGKVPVLRTKDTILFESAVIAEYLDETHPPTLHPKDPLKKAHNRSWIEFGSNLNFEQHDLLWAKTKQDYEKQFETLRADLKRIEDQFSVGPYFNGDNFSLVDAAYAPPLMRFSLIENYHSFNLLKGYSKLNQWCKVLLARSCVKKSVVADFEELYIKAVKNGQGYAAQYFN